MLAHDRYENVILMASWEDEKLNQQASMVSAETISHSPARYRSYMVQILRDKRVCNGYISQGSQFQYSVPVNHGTPLP